MHYISTAHGVAGHIAKGTIYVVSKALSITESMIGKVAALAAKTFSVETQSCFYQLDNKVDIYQREIGYINGIGTSFDVAKDNAKRLSDNICQGFNIHGVWNPSQGFFGDLINSIRLMKGSLPKPTSLLINQWKGFLQNNPPHTNYLQICFSQGALMVRNALNQMDPDLRKRIHVIAIAPACFFNPDEDLNVRHFIKRSDIVPTVFASGNHRLNRNEPDIINVPENDNAYPHDLHGIRYQESIRPYINRYIETGSIL